MNEASTHVKGHVQKIMDTAFKQAMAWRSVHDAITPGELKHLILQRKTDFA